METKVTELLSQHQLRSFQFSQKPFFYSVKNGLLDDTEKCQKFAYCMQRWAEKNQTVLFGYANKNQPNAETDFFDPVLEALLNWFIYQMTVLDRLEKKVLIDLVLNQANSIYHTMLKPHIANNRALTSTLTQLKNANESLSFDEAILYSQSFETLHRIHEVMDLSWNMVEALLDRISELTNGEIYDTRIG